jgi:glyoxylase-like metal-dependent hydrolase (beta-lactamase superfamily II)
MPACPNAVIRLARPALGAGLIAAISLGLISAFTPVGVGAQAADFETTRIADGVFQYRWQGHNGFFVVTPDGVVAVDPISPEAARQYAREIKRVAPGASLVAIVYSHQDADHATGAAALMSEMGQTVPIIAHRNSLPALTMATSVDLPVPTVTYQEYLSIDLGGRRVELHYVGANHTDNSTVVYVPDARVAFAVDFVSHDRVGYQQLPGWVFPDFFESMSRLLEINFDTIVFGHGPAGDRDSIHRQIRYYDKIRSEVRRALSAGWTEDRAAEEIRLPEFSDWDQYEAWFPLNVRAIYRWMGGR